MQLIIPKFWRKKRSLIALFLFPFSVIYHLISKINYWLKSRNIYVSKAKIITIGNINIGGVGKTPVCLSLAEKMNDFNKKLVILTRGYGGTEEGPLMVKASDDSKKFGDEAVLLAQNFSTYVAKDRLKGIKFLEELGFEIIITDDGLQDPRFKKDLSILVVDGEFGLGNGLIFPAGPLRESFSSGVKKADLCVFIEKCEFKIESDKLLIANIEIKISLDNKNYIIDQFKFGDHHQFKDQELESLILLAKEKKVDLITTEKDYTRIKEKYREYIKTLPIRITWQNEEKLKNHLQYL